MKALVALAVLLGLVAPAQVRAQTPPAEEDYVLNCSGCHRADGRGVDGSVPSLVGIDRLLVVPEGRAYLVRAPGVAQAPLDDARLARLLNYVVESFGGSPPPTRFTAEEVAPLRQHPLRAPTRARARLLGRIAEAAGAP